MALISVSTEVSAMVEKAAKLVCTKAGVENDKFNQDLNAFAGLVVLQDLGIEIPVDVKDKVRQALKKLGNASALRQAISGERKTAEKSSELMDALAEL